MKVTVDVGLCDGNGDCEDLLPQVFRVGENGIVELLTADVGDELQGRLEEAVDCCPTRAISIGS